jgi:hypothetical protein
LPGACPSLAAYKTLAALVKFDRRQATVTVPGCKYGPLHRRWEAALRRSSFDGHWRARCRKPISGSAARIRFNWEAYKLIQYGKIKTPQNPCPANCLQSCISKLAVQWPSQPVLRPAFGYFFRRGILCAKTSARRDSVRFEALK